MVVFGLFAPYLHGFDDDCGYDITKLGRYYRRLSIIKHRNGISNVNVGLYFDGGTRTFVELPKYEDTTNLEKVYRHIDSLESSNFS